MGMNIHTVAENLRRTIADKEVYLARQHENRKSEDAQVRMVSYAFIKMLDINIDELRRILQDVEQSIPKIEHDLDGPMIKKFRED